MVHSNEQYVDIVVVGAGLAGLTAAATAAAAGHSVTVLEKRTHNGGRATTDELDGYLFNQGAHALYAGGIGAATLKRLGVEPRGEAPPLAGTALLGGELSPLPYGVRSLLQTRAVRGRGRFALGRLISRITRLDPTAHDGETVDQWLAAERRDVRELATALVRVGTYTAATDLLSAGVAIRQLQLVVETGVLYLDGGWATLVDQLEAAVERVGGIVITGSGVESIEHRTDGFVIAHDGRTLSSGSVIVATGGPDVASGLLRLPSSTFADAGPPVTASVLDLALPSMPAHRFVLGIDEPLYFSVHSPPARLAPPGAAAAVAMRYLHPESTTSADNDRRSLEAVAEAAGIPTPVRTRFLRRMTVTHGMPLAARGGTAGRPRVEVAGVRGAFVAGDWVGGDGLLADAAIASGAMAARLAGELVAGRETARL
ncbi:MAG: FAD-dependent oxidoreductase [Acidimicrobiia bacterium]|nr:FAD-dependent oxidoreductase [Acidimicrobiia bacterium]